MSGEEQETRRASDVPLPGGDFRLFTTRLSIQAMLSLGLVENPLTKTKQVNPGNARMLIADLLMLRERTAGNLDPEESAHLEKMISDLTWHAERILPPARSQDG